MGLKSRWSVLLLAMLLAVFAVAAACDDDDDEVADEGETAGETADTGDTADDDAMEDDAMEDDAMEDDAEGDDAAAVTLEAAVAGIDSDAAGTVTIAANADGKTEVTVAMTGLSEGAHANHLHHGSCAEQGEVHVPLTELEADADGNATATTVVDDLDVAHFAEGHYYAVHTEGDDTVGDVIGCGDVMAPAA